MRSNIRRLAALTAMAFGTVLIIGDVFLVAWNLRAGEAHDIAARGPWLLAMLRPQMLCAAGLTLVVLAFYLGRRGAWPLSSRILLPVLAVLVAGALLYTEPTSVVFRVILPIRRSFGGAGAALLDVAFILVGGWILWNTKNPVDSTAPAV